MCVNKLFACSCREKTCRMYIGLFCLNGLLCWFIAVDSNILGYSEPRAIQLNHYSVDFEWNFRKCKYLSNACSFFLYSNIFSGSALDKHVSFANCHWFPLVTSSLALCQDRWPNPGVRYYVAAPSIPGCLSVYHRGMSPCWHVNGISHW